MIIEELKEYIDRTQPERIRRLDKFQKAIEAMAEARKMFDESMERLNEVRPAPAKVCKFCPFKPRSRQDIIRHADLFHGGKI